jgi:hypothetical protein
MIHGIGNDRAFPYGQERLWAHFSEWSESRPQTGTQDEGCFETSLVQIVNPNENPKSQYLNPKLEAVWKSGIHGVLFV